MAILEEQLRYVSASDFPNGSTQKVTIERYYEEQGKRGVDRMLQVLVGVQQRRLTIWGEVMTELIKKFGKNTDLWEGKEFNMRLERMENGKLKRVVV